MTGDEYDAISEGQQLLTARETEEPELQAWIAWNHSSGWPHLALNPAITPGARQDLLTLSITGAFDKDELKAAHARNAWRILSKRFPIETLQAEGWWARNGLPHPSTWNQS